MKFSWTSLIEPVLGFIRGLISDSKERKERRRLEKEAEARAEAEKEYIEGKTDEAPLKEITEVQTNI